MHVKIWGARGSVPVSGPQYVRYGGDTTCLEIVSDSGDVVVFDAGTGIRSLGNDLLNRMPDGGTIHLFLTHAHWDHVIGFPFFRPLYRKQFTLKFHGCSNAQESISSFFETTMKPPFFPVPIEEAAANLVFTPACEDEVLVDGFRVRSVPLNHPNGGKGFVVSEHGRNLVFFPDNELTRAHPEGLKFDDYAREFEGADVLIHDSEYTPEEYSRFATGWGHSVFHDSVRLAKSAGVKSLVMWHINQDRDDAEMDAMVAEARADATGSGMSVDSARTGMTMTL